MSVLEYIYITNLLELKPLLATLEQLKPRQEIGLDIETWGLDARQSALRLVQLKIGDSIFIINCEKLENKYLKYILQILESKESLFILHNGKFDLKFIYHNTGIMLNNIYDSMIAESVITGAKNKFASLNFLLKKYLSVVMDKETRELFTTSETITQEMLMYSAKDVLYLNDLKEKQDEAIAEYKLDATVDLEMKIIPAVAKMEYDGINFNTELWLELAEFSKTKVKQLEPILLKKLWSGFTANNTLKENALKVFEQFSIPVRTKKLSNALVVLGAEDLIFEVWKEHFNLGSTYQLKDALNLCGIEVENTSANELKKYRDNEIISLILEYKAWKKKVDAFGEKYLSYLHPVTNRIHADFIQNGTETGRFSSSSPNLQQVPRDVLKEDVLDSDQHPWYNRAMWRECFVPTPGYQMITADYSQQEYKIVGQITGEPKIIQAYASGMDMHTATASVIHGVAPQDVTKEQRTIGKAVNFGLLYGMGYWKLAKSLGISPEEGKELFNKIITGFPVFSKFKEDAEKVILSRMMSRTMTGRVRFFEKKEDFKDSKDVMKYFARVQREGFNHIIQGTAADMLKLAIYYCYINNPFKDKFRILLLVHDEIVAEAENEIVEEAKDFLTECMDNAFSYYVKVISSKVDAMIKPYWSK